MFNLLTAQRRIFTSKLRPMERLVALAILDHWSTGSTRPWPSFSTLECATGLSKRSVVRAVQGLVAAGAVRVDLRRPAVEGRMVPNAKPTNHYDLSGLMSLPVSEGHRCHTGTSAPLAPVPESPPTSATQAPELVPDRHPKEPNEGTKEGTQIDLVFAHWVSVLWKRHHGDEPKRSTKATKNRLATIRSRLRDGYTVHQLKQVVDAVARSDFHNGVNDRGATYIEPKTIFHPDKVDGWLATKAPVNGKRLPPAQQGMDPSYEQGTL